MARLLRNAFTRRSSILAAEIYSKVTMGESSHFCYLYSTVTKKIIKRTKSDESDSNVPTLSNLATNKTKSDESDLVVPTPSKKDLALQEAINQITTSFGAGSIMWLGRSEHKIVPVISTGCIALDMALGAGGLPKGRVVEIYGPEASGKTTLALHVIAESQKLGGNCVFIDAEHALDPTLAESIGVSTKNLLLSQPDSGEQALSLVDILIRSGSVDVVVVDSVAALVPKSELEGEMGDPHMALQARLMSQALRKLSHSLSLTQTLLIFINQVRSKISTFSYGPAEITCGGNALKFYSSVRLSLRRVGNIPKGTSENATGSVVKVTVIKNKIAPPFKTASFQLMFGRGISQEDEIIDLALKLEIMRQMGSYFSINNKSYQGRDAALKFLRENGSVREELLVKIKERLRSGEKCIDDDNEEEQEEGLSVVAV